MDEPLLFICCEWTNPCCSYVVSRSQLCFGFAFELGISVSVLPIQYWSIVSMYLTWFVIHATLWYYSCMMIVFVVEHACLVILVWDITYVISTNLSPEWWENGSIFSGDDWRLSLGTDGPPGRSGEVRRRISVTARLSCGIVHVVHPYLVHCGGMMSVLHVFIW